MIIVNDIYIMWYKVEIFRNFKYIWLFFVYLDIVVRFVGGVMKYEGWLEVYRLGKWGIVCDNGLNDVLFVVVCWLLGFFW